MTYRAVTCHDLPGQVRPNHACRANPCHAPPGLARPCLPRLTRHAKPIHDLPCQAETCHACRAAPRPALPSPASPYQDWTGPACPDLPCLDQTRLDRPSQACQAMPNRVMPHPDPPGPAEPCRACRTMPSHEARGTSASMRLGRCDISRCSACARPPTRHGIARTPHPSQGATPPRPPQTPQC